MDIQWSTRDYWKGPILQWTAQLLTWWHSHGFGSDPNRHELVCHCHETVGALRVYKSGTLADKQRPVQLAVYLPHAGGQQAMSTDNQQTSPGSLLDSKVYGHELLRRTPAMTHVRTTSPSWTVV